MNIKKIQANWQLKSFFGLILTINALLTFSFGFNFGGSLTPVPSQMASNFLDGIIYFVFFDYAAARWFKAKTEAKSNEQRATADFLMRLSLYTSILFSAIQLIYTTPLLNIGAYTAYIGYVAVGATLLVVGGHFYGLYDYLANDPDFVKADQDGAQQARLASARAKAMTKAIEASAEKVEAIMGENRETIAQIMADQSVLDVAAAMGYSGPLKLSDGRIVHVAQAVKLTPVVKVDDQNSQESADVFTEAKTAYSNGVSKVVESSPLSASGN